MSLFTDILNVVKENPIAAGVCAAAGAIVVGATWAVTAACSGDKKQEPKADAAAAATAAADATAAPAAEQAKA